MAIDARLRSEGGAKYGEGHARRLFDKALTQGWDMSKVGAK